MALIDAVEAYKPGDLPPEGYLQWHEWARVQHRAGLRQEYCGSCSRYKFPQELDDKVLSYTACDSTGREVEVEYRRCKACAEGVAS